MLSFFLKKPTPNEQSKQNGEQEPLVFSEEASSTPKISHPAHPPGMEDASTPKISHPFHGKDQARLRQKLIVPPDETLAISNFKRSSYQRSSSAGQERSNSGILLELHDDYEDNHVGQQHHHHRIVIEGKPGDWVGLHRSADNNDMGSYYSKESIHTGIHTLESISSVLTETAHKIVDASFRLQGPITSIRDFGGTSTCANEIFNLVKNLVGAGALGLPRGVAIYANHPNALVPACFLLVLMSGIFGYYFLLMGRICRITKTASYREAWEVTIGEQVAGLVPLCIILMAGLGNLAYSMILADTTKSLLETAGLVLTRTQSLIAVTVLVLLSLCMVKHLSVLAPFSALGSVGMVFTVFVMGLRYIDGTYREGGIYIDHLPDDLRPSFGEVGAAGAWSGNFLILVCMTFQAYFAHYNAPRYYVELRNNTIPRFSAVVAGSFGFSALFYILLTVFGFLTFGANANGFILNNYSTNDELASFCRLAIAVAVACTYPLPFIGVRDGIIDILMVPEAKQTSSNLNALSLILLAVFTGLAMQFTDLGLLNAVGGGALGSAVVFILPALMFRGAVRYLGKDATRWQRREAAVAMGCMWILTAIGLIGTGIGIMHGA